MQTCPCSAHRQPEQTRRGGRRNYPGDPSCDSPAAAVLSWPRQGETVRVTPDYRSQLLLTRGQPRLTWPTVQREPPAFVVSLHPGGCLYSLPEFPLPFFYPCKSSLCRCVATISLPLNLRQFDCYVFKFKRVARIVPGSPRAQQGTELVDGPDAAVFGS